MEELTQEEEKKFYKKVLHSGLLCDKRDCDICHPLPKCHLENRGQTDTGKNKIMTLVCYCGTTGCKNIKNFMV